MHLPDTLRADLDRYVAVLDERYGCDLISVVLFGSWARGQGRDESDLDVLLVIRGLTGSRFDRYRPLEALAREVSSDLSDRLSLIASTPEGAARVKPYYLGMLSGHVVLRDRDGFFAGVIARLQERLRELGARRYVDEDGYGYWDLKPDWTPGDVVRL